MIKTTIKVINQDRMFNFSWFLSQILTDFHEILQTQFFKQKNPNTHTATGNSLEAW